MTKPTKPTVPEPAIRSQPEWISERIEASILFWPTLTTYMDESSDYVDGVNTQVQAAALAGNLSSLDMSAIAGLVIGVNDAGTNVEGVEVVEAIKATEAQAEAGTDDEAYMTPLTTKAAVDQFAPIFVDGSGVYSAYTAPSNPVQNTTGRTLLVYWTQVYNVSNNVQVSSDGVTYHTIGANGANNENGLLVWFNGDYLKFAGSTPTFTIRG